MSCFCLLSSAALLVCARAYEIMPAPPQAQEPKVVASEGGTATLRCLFHGNPTPKITWRFRGHTIDSDADRYRLMANGVLEINPLYRSDTGVYFCVAENSFGIDLQEVVLVVNDLAQERNCSQFREEYYEQALVCPYGMHTWTQDGCERWKCKEHPCVRTNCLSSEHCEAVALSSASSQGDLYSARCVADVSTPHQAVPQKELVESEGGTATLRCLFPGNSPPKIMWKFRKLAKYNSSIEVMDNENCTEVKPDEEQPCMQQRYDGVDWITSNWFGCDSCTSKFRTRTVVCATKSWQLLNESFCSHSIRPADHEECDKDVLPACEVQWYATQWSKCSVNCGDGVQTRKVFCGMYYDDESGEGVEVIEDSKCANLTKYKDTKPCTVPKEECPSQWFAGSWSTCSEGCGGGEQYRRVMCFRGDKEATDCDNTAVVETMQLCNTGPCHSDVPAVPQTVPRKEPDVAASEGGEVTIDSNAGRYRLMSDGALEIVSLYRNDTGVYICVAGNSFGVATQEIHLTVNDPVRTPAGIAGDENATTVIGELFLPFHVRCLAYGYPPPFVFWYRNYEDALALYNDTEYEVRGNDLAFRSLSIDILGKYTCRAYNEVGNASWGFVVKAYKPDGIFIEHKYLVERQGAVATRPRKQPPINATTGTTTTTITEATSLLFTETSTTAALTDATIDTTESIETSEGSTTNEGTTDVITDVIATTTLEPCRDFKFGCCADNETEASGLDGQGCPCNATEFGCCPDGVSSASGLENEGCPGPCSTSPHGCCQDDKTPAHGPDFEGCCLLQAFGCCPDNRKPAEGQHLEGCGCQYALHGCCPDNVTIAQGPDNQGCGCQYTQHGCCPDRHTAASGPNNEGCACNTYQFGCCADGVTTAKGPEQQGCHCRDSKFGCCGDGETHATGPDAAGCDCSSSRHGCCPDGRTEATGPKFLGCTDAPENKQAACSMSTDPGPCHNFTATWYYDLAYGGCSRFWYGGCEGNGNRFVTKEDCEDVCVHPSSRDACKLPSVKGACDADHQRWHYNSTRKQCIPFRYGGCLGNANNFNTREICQKQCEPSSVAGQCNLPIDQGSCAGNYSRWGFISVAHRCEQYVWGGCEGNSNRFSSEAACQMRCVGTQSHKQII